MSARVYVGGLAPESAEHDLRELFQTAGLEPESVEIARDTKRARSRGFAFVELGSEEESEAAINQLHGKELAGRTLKVGRAHVRREVHGGFGKPEGFRGIHAYGDKPPKRRRGRR